jgi:hypothetical protein
MPIVFYKDKQPLTLEPSSFSDEKELEKQLADTPNLLKGTNDPPIAVVKAQVTLPEAGNLDLLCVNESGLPIAVEVKLERNGEARRQIVAQAIDYVSSLTLLTVDELDRIVGGALEQALHSFDEGEETEKFEQRWQAVGANLRAGLARVVLALDEAPRDLQRMVRFLAQRSSLDIQLVVVSKYSDEQVGTIFVPQWLVEAEGEAAVSKTPRPDDQYIDRAVEMVKNAARETWGTDPVVERENWRTYGTAVRVFPMQARAHEATFVIRPDGKFRIQLRPQEDKITPGTNRSDFTGDGMFTKARDESPYLKDEFNQRTKTKTKTWVFVATRDEETVESALNTLKTALSLLKAKTQ